MESKELIDRISSGTGDLRNILDQIALEKISDRIAEKRVDVAIGLLNPQEAEQE